jgi:hypothetical protein
MLTSQIDTVTPRRITSIQIDELLQQLASRDAMIAQLEQRCAELAISAKRAETEALSVSTIVELATQYITATNAAVSGSAYLELRRAVAERSAK